MGLLGASTAALSAVACPSVQGAAGNGEAQRLIDEAVAAVRALNGRSIFCDSVC